MEIVTDDLMFNKVKFFVNILNNKIDTPQEITLRHLTKADALRMKNYFWESIDEYLIVIKHDKTCVDAYKGLGYSYKQTGYTQSAVDSFNEAKKLSSFDKILYYEAGCCYCMDKKYNKAIIEFKKAVKICPEYSEAHLNLALAYELNNQFDLAIKNYLKIIEDLPENVAAYNALGSLYIKLEMFNKAIKIFRQLLKINKDYSRAYLGIAISFDKTNCNSDSMRYYKKYMKLKPNCGNLPFILDRIKELQSCKISRKKSHLQLVS